MILNYRNIIDLSTSKIIVLYSLVISLAVAIETQDYSYDNFPIEANSGKVNKIVIFTCIIPKFNCFHF